MKTLYERLKQEHKDVLAYEAKQFKHSIGHATDAMKSKVIISDLTYGEIGVLVNHLNLKSYDPLVIYNLFES
jgi:hypothetical protein